jgi:hypothetical protein
MQQFGLDFQVQSQDQQPGLFAGDPLQTQQQPPLGDPAAPAAPGGGATAGIGTPNIAAAAAPGVINAPSASPNPAAVGGQSPTSPSPLASPLGSQSPLGPPQNEPAPAAGVGSQFTGGKV